jgi:methanobactin biosynthesis MbnP-like protein
MTVLVMATSFINTSGKDKVYILFKNVVGDKLLNLDSVTYFNKYGQSYSISKLKYYIGNIHLKKKDGTEYSSSYYFLINEEESKSKQITLENFPEGEYTSMSFIIGVDSIHNCSGAQSGALDPMNAMFWAWNTGYIFLKLEGNSPVSQSPGNLLEFHIGGYKEPNNCIRTVTLELNNKYLSERENSITVINIKADISKVFNATTKIDFSKISSVTDYHNATMIADNYKDMFSVISINDK